MGKAPSKPKKLSYRLITKDSIAGLALYPIVDELIDQHHEDLRTARIALAWNLSWKPDVDGRVTLGKCKKASELDRELAEYDFVIILRQEFFEDARVTDLQRRALIDHELCHAAVKFDENSEPVVDERGRTVYRTRKHDLEEFESIAARYGCWKRDIEAFASALDRARSQSDGHWVGFTKLAKALENAGAAIPLDTVRTWSDTERREAELWALLTCDLKQRTAKASLVPTCPVHVRTAIDALEPPAVADDDVAAIL